MASTSHWRPRTSTKSPWTTVITHVSFCDAPLQVRYPIESSLGMRIYATYSECGYALEEAGDFSFASRIIANH